MDELPPNTRVTDGSRRGVLVRYETKFRTRWAVVCWDGKSFVAREYPHRITVVAPNPA